jgi:proteasome lid subunit RPN8/RPN11
MQDRLILSAHARDALHAEAARAHPPSAAGCSPAAPIASRRSTPVSNTAEDPSRRYEMDPAELWAARRAARDAGHEVIGFYHSHPRTPPFPSSLDVERAYYPEAVYAIAALEPASRSGPSGSSNGHSEELPIVTPSSTVARERSGA